MKARLTLLYLRETDHWGAIFHFIFLKDKTIVRPSRTLAFTQWHCWPMFNNWLAGDPWYWFYWFCIVKYFHSGIGRRDTRRYWVREWGERDHWQTWRRRPLLLLVLQRWQLRSQGCRPGRCDLYGVGGDRAPENSRWEILYVSQLVISTYRLNFF